MSELEGERIEVGAGDWIFIPQGVFHNLVVTSDTSVKVLVIYAPPYGERPGAAVLREPAE